MPLSPTMDLKQPTTLPCKVRPASLFGKDLTQFHLRLEKKCFVKHCSLFLINQAVVKPSPVLQAPLQALATPAATPTVPTVPGTSLLLQATWFDLRLTPSTWSTMITVTLITWRSMTVALCRMEPWLEGTWLFDVKWRLYIPRTTVKACYSVSVPVRKSVQYITRCFIQYLSQSYLLNFMLAVCRYCGRSVPPSITSTNNFLTLLFVTDVSLATEGFSATYVSIDASTGTQQYIHFFTHETI